MVTIMDPFRGKKNILLNSKYICQILEWDYWLWCENSKNVMKKPISSKIEFEQEVPLLLVLNLSYWQVQALTMTTIHNTFWIRADN